VRGLAFVLLVLLSVGRVQSGEPPPLRVVPSANASEKELLSKITSVLPDGWTAAYTTYDGVNHFLDIDRVHETMLVSGGPNPAPDEKPTSGKISFDLRLLPFMPTKTFGKLKAENQDLGKKMYAIVRAVTHGRPYMGSLSDLESTDENLSDEDRKKIAIYYRLESEMHEVPKFYFHDISLDWASQDPDRLGLTPAPVDEVIARECQDVLKKIEAVLTKY
jgi:hypothetical protein